MFEGLKVGGKGMVLPPSEKENTLPKAPFNIIIESVVGENDGILDENGKKVASDYQMARVLYPDGSVKNHQVKSVEDLAEKVVSQLRGAFGSGDVKFTKVPSSLKAKEKFTVGE